MKRSKFLKSGLCALVAAVVFSRSQASAKTLDFITLPDPTSTIDGILVAIQYDDYLSYSGKLLNLWQNKPYYYLPEATYGDYDFSVGTGNLDLLLYSKPGGANNQGIEYTDPPYQGAPGTGATYNFEDLVTTATGADNTVDGWWGQNDQNNDGLQDVNPNNGHPVDVHGPVFVGNLLNYLHEFNPENNTPVFIMDLNQGGGTTP